MTDAEAVMGNVVKDPWLNPSGGAISIHDRMPDIDPAHSLRRVRGQAVPAVER